MRHPATLSTLVTIGALLLSGCHSKHEPAGHDGLYFDLVPPGLEPVLFASGIVSTDELEIEPAFAPDMKAFYFTRQRPGEVPMTHVIRYENGQWGESVKSPHVGEISISPDGSTMHLGADYRERTATGWSQIKTLSAEFSTYPIMRLTSSLAQTYVFDERDEVGTIRYSRKVDGERTLPVAFGPAINSGKWTGHPFIAPDESYLIWDSEREGGYGGSDLYVSFRQEDGAWGPVLNLGAAVNSPYEDAFGSVTPDGKYLMFHRINLDEGNGTANIFWVSALVLQNLRAPEHRRCVKGEFSDQQRKEGC